MSDTTYLPTIAVDFDGVIHKYSKGWQDGSAYDEPMEDAFEAIVYLLQHHTVFIHSTRPAIQIIEWCETHDAPFPVEQIDYETQFWNKEGVVGVTNRKLPAVAYIDDRAVRFSSWAHTIMLIGMLEERGR